MHTSSLFQRHCRGKGKQYIEHWASSVIEVIRFLTLKQGLMTLVAYINAEVEEEVECCIKPKNWSYECS